MFIKHIQLKKVGEDKKMPLKYFYLNYYSLFRPKRNIDPSITVKDKKAEKNSHLITVS